MIDTSRLLGRPTSAAAESGGRPPSMLRAIRWSFGLALGALLLVAPGTASADEGLLGGLTGGVGEIVEPVVEPVVEPLSEATQPVTAAIEPVTDLAEPIVEPAVEPIIEPLVEPVSELTAPVTEAVEPVTQFVEPVVEPVVGLVDPLVEPVVEPLTGLVEPVRGSVVEPIVDPIVQPVSELVEPVAAPPVTQLVDPVVQPLTKPVSTVPDPASSIVEPDLGGVEPATPVVAGPPAVWAPPKPAFDSVVPESAPMTLPGSASAAVPVAPMPEVSIWTKAPEALDAEASVATANSDLTSPWWTRIAPIGAFGGLDSGQALSSLSIGLSIALGLLLLYLLPPPVMVRRLHLAAVFWQPQRFVGPLERPG